MRLIDAEWIRNIYADFEHYENRDDWTTPITNVLAVIDDAPSIDIVRCKECKWFDAGENESDSWHLCTRHFGKYINFAEDDYCSYGEREGE